MIDGAVLLGDLVGSRRHAADAIDRAMRALADTADRLAPVTGPARFTRFRGDGWQLVTSRPEMTLRIGLCLMARLVADGSPETRVAIGVGQIDRLPEGDLGAASGSAFLRSGQALDDMPARRRLRLEGLLPTDRGLLDGMLHLTETVAARWSPLQAEAVLLALVPGRARQVELAQSLGISPQAVNQRLLGAGLPAIETALAAFEALGWRQSA
ncbi:MAG: helix-turn-helix domain-containing protein [Rhodobacteraceae bacterium]|jgi:hypothetical protein|nr:helix-turn-helix domain-containing protein [Paracoccaceae bacterium]